MHVHQDVFLRNTYIYDYLAPWLQQCMGEPQNACTIMENTKNVQITIDIYLAMHTATMLAICMDVCVLVYKLYIYVSSTCSS